MEDLDLPSEQSISKSENMWPGWLETLTPTIPVVAPHASYGYNRLQNAAGNISVSRVSDERDNASRIGDQSPSTIHTASNMNQSTQVDPVNDSLWAQVRYLLPSEEDSNTAIDLDSLDRVLSSMGKTFLQHEGSQDCLVCGSMADFSPAGAIHNVDLVRLRHELEDATQSEKEAVFKYHVPPPDPRLRVRFDWSSIDKVDFVLEKHERWSAIRLQEFRKTEKTVRVGDGMPPLYTYPDVPDVFQKSKITTESLATHKSRSYSPDPIKFDQTLAVAPEDALMAEHRQHAKDVCVLVPFQDGKRGLAREVTESLDVELIKLWLSQCDIEHTLCSRQNEDSCHPGLILIDAEMMCLVTVATAAPVPYIALSYVWGYVAQPVLTKAVLGLWTLKGQLRNVQIPQTIRDAIQLVQMIGYR
ncbi:hypothetical protein J7T55_005310 [Diaporthe amygdali]|uniref:uncharacterized protein n=1 Tax=Phomopsis amygdali TaxID=1214568 RepID=UPI0022FF3382|nr:uncharacterized protein J7T55_005310 [Diaporthe amygdali]KAJ0108333.1 hypothetical protein J7T55_005310 [Diaporthe amygdali]